MKTKITIFACLISALLSSPTIAKQKLAVMDLDAISVSDDIAFTLSDVLRDEIHAQGEYEVLSKEDLDALARRTSLQQQAGDCTDAQCLADLGKALGTKYMVYGTISKLGNTYSISLRLLDTEGKDAGVKNRVNERCKCNEDGLFDMTLTAAAKIMGKKSAPFSKLVRSAQVITTPVPEPNTFHDLKVRVIYVARRKDDAEVIRGRLEKYGATVEMSNIGKDAPFEFKGKILSRNGFEKQAHQIIRVVSDIEELVLADKKATSNSGQHFNLWVAR